MMMMMMMLIATIYWILFAKHLTHSFNKYCFSLSYLTHNNPLWAKYYFLQMIKLNGRALMKLVQLPSAGFYSRGGTWYRFSFYSKAHILNYSFISSFISSTNIDCIQYVVGSLPCTGDVGVNKAGRAFILTERQTKTSELVVRCWCAGRKWCRC